MRRLPLLTTAALAACAGRALAEHPAMLARFHARLAATLLARPFASIPPLAPPPNDPGASASGGALLDAGADPRASADRLLTDHAAGMKGVTPEEVAVRNGHEAVAAMLRTAAGAR